MDNAAEIMSAGVQQQMQEKLEQIQQIEQNVQNVPKSASEWHDLISGLTESAIGFGLKLIAAIAIFSVGMWLAKRITKSVAFAMERRSLEPSLISFASSFINILLRIFVIVIVLTTVGVQMTSIVAVMGAGALAVGMALSGTFQNFAGGIIILFLKPFKVGDVIETTSGKTGTVKKIMIFTTELHTFDNQVVFLPNGPLANGEIINLTDRKNRRTELKIGISYGDDVDAARRVILGVLSGEKLVLKDPAPSVALTDLADSSVVLTVWYWTKFTDIVSVKAVVMEKIYKELPKNNINFPFPQMDVHIQK